MYIRTSNRRLVSEIARDLVYHSAIRLGNSHMQSLKLTVSQSVRHSSSKPVIFSMGVSQSVNQQVHLGVSQSVNEASIRNDSYLLGSLVSQASSVEP